MARPAAHSTSAAACMRLGRSPRNGHASKHRPDRHRVGEDRHPRRRGGELGEGAEHGEGDDVEERGDDDMQPGLRGRNAQAAALEAARQIERQRAERRRHRAHAQRRNFVERDPHDRPGHAPDEAQARPASAARRHRRRPAASCATSGFSLDGSRRNVHGALGPAPRYQSAICAPVQNSTSGFLRMTSKMRRKYFSAMRRAHDVGMHRQRHDARRVRPHPHRSARTGRARARNIPTPCGAGSASWRRRCIPACRAG